MEAKDKTVKLTLQVKERTVKRAKQYARKRKTSVSALKNGVSWNSPV